MFTFGSDIFGCRGAGADRPEMILCVTRRGSCAGCPAWIRAGGIAVVVPGMRRLALPLAGVRKPRLLWRGGAEAGGGVWGGGGGVGGGGGGGGACFVGP